MTDGEFEHIWLMLVREVYSEEFSITAGSPSFLRALQPPAVLDEAGSRGMCKASKEKSLSVGFGSP